MRKLSLNGKVIALSISDAPDRLKLGFPPQEVDRALFSICTALLRSGARILYAGDLRANGFTVKLFRQLAGLYVAEDRHDAFILLFSEPVLRDVGFEHLAAALSQIHEFSEAFAFVGEEKFRITFRTSGLMFESNQDGLKFENAAGFNDWLGALPVSEAPTAYTIMRSQASDGSAGRIALGGKMGLIDHSRDSYEGAMPGIAEEAKFSLMAHKPFIPLGAFGGCTRDIAIALGILPEEAEVPRGVQRADYRRTMEMLSGFAEFIPVRFKERLKFLARNDQPEELALCSVSLLHDWLSENDSAPQFGAL